MPIAERNGRITIAVRVQPRASRSELAGLHGSELKIRLAAPPVDGAANEECVRFMAQVLGVARAAVAIQSGHASRSKVVSVVGIGAEQARRLLGLAD